MSARSGLVALGDSITYGEGGIVLGVDGRSWALWLAQALDLPAPRHAHVPLVFGPDGRRLAKRHGAVTLDEVPAARAVAWMAASVGLPPATRAPELLDAFDPAALPREPTVLTPPL